MNSMGANYSQPGYICQLTIDEVLSRYIQLTPIVENQQGRISSNNSKYRLEQQSSISLSNLN